jgi:hypothetical protein
MEVAAHLKSHRRNDMKEFRIGGERQPVYEFMRDYGFVMSKWSDKVWTRADGLQASIYGAGSMVRLSRDGKEIVESLPFA